MAGVAFAVEGDGVGFATESYAASALCTTLASLSGTLWRIRRVKTTEAGGPRGYDAGKKIKGRKRHLLTDTAGFLIAGIVHEASIQDRDGAPALLRLIRSAFPWLRHVFADGGYAGQDRKSTRLNSSHL